MGKTVKSIRKRTNLDSTALVNNCLDIIKNRFKLREVHVRLDRNAVTNYFDQREITKTIEKKDDAAHHLGGIGTKSKHEFLLRSDTVALNKVKLPDQGNAAGHGSFQECQGGEACNQSAQEKPFSFVFQMQHLKPNPNINIDLRMRMFNSSATLIPVGDFEGCPNQFAEQAAQFRNGVLRAFWLRLDVLLRQCSSKLLSMPCKERFRCIDNIIDEDVIFTRGELHTTQIVLEYFFNRLNKTFNDSASDPDADLEPNVDADAESSPNDIGFPFLLL